MSVGIVQWPGAVLGLAVTVGLTAEGWPRHMLSYKNSHYIPPPMTLQQEVDVYT